MKKFPLFLALLVMMTSAHAAMIYTDTFSGSATANQTTNPNLIGSSWVIDSGTWALTGAGTSPANFALRANGGGENFITEDAVQTLNTGGATFTLASQIYLGNTSTYLGMVFNYIDSSNYILIRAEQTNLQAYDYVNGVRTTLFNDSISQLATSYYDINISFNGTSYIGSLTSADGLTTYDTHSFAPVSSLTNGYAGLYSSSSSRFFDNFSLIVVPEPSSLFLCGFAGVALFCFHRRSIKSRLS